MKSLRFQDPTQSKHTLEGGLVVRVETDGVRRVYLSPSDAAAANYYVGWIVDTDLEACSICSLKWTWMRTRHHCRACGSLVCSACSPYRAQLANFTSEEGGSRCCTQCFGLKMSSTQHTTATSVSASASASAPAASAVTTTMSMDAYDAQTKKFEAEQRPLYQIAYEQTRGLVPLDVARSSVQKMVEEGLPESIAARLWRCRSLWLVCMATEDIAKVHIADFRSKYDFHGLDIVEMRALWFVLDKVEWDRTIPSLISKCEWRDGLKTKLDEMAIKEADDCLPAQEQRNIAYRGHAENLRIYDPAIKIEPRYLGLPNSAVAGISPCRAAAASAGSVRQTPARAAASPTLSITPIPAPSAVGGEEPCDNDEALDAEIDSWKLSPLPALSPLPPTESDDALSPMPESAVLSPQLPRRAALSRRRAPSGADGAATRSPLRLLSSPVRTSVPFVHIDSPLNTSECEDEKDKVKEKDRDEAPSSAALMAALFGGRAGEARSLKNRGASIDRAMATTILLHCAEDPDSLAEPLETLEVLVEELGAEVDPTTEDGKTALLLLCFNAELGSFLVCAGADVLRDDCEGSNALQTTFEYGIEYMLETFVSCGREETLLQSGSDEDKNKYLCVLIFGGHATKAKALLRDSRVPPIDPEALPELLEVFKSNMESWHEPVDTYELLESWGAKW